MIWFHTVIGVVALGSGLLVMLRAKGTAFHRRAGWTYVASMYVLCATSFAIEASSPIFRGMGMFHLMATVSAATVTAGLVPVLRRRSADWFESHLVFMLWSYVGLVMALNSHFMNTGHRVMRRAIESDALTWSLLIACGWVLPFAVGMVTIPRAAARYAKTFPVPAAPGSTRGRTAGGNA